MKADIYHLVPNAMIHRLYMAMAYGSDSASFDALDQMIQEGLYKKVATITYPTRVGLEQVWEDTNHIDESWHLRPNVQLFGDRHRSSMVGDIFVCQDLTESPTVAKVGSFGFVRLVDPYWLQLLEGIPS